MDGTYTEYTWPKDAVLLSQEESDAYWRVSPPNGKIIGATQSGSPCWVDIPPLPHAEQVAQANATKSILQRDAEEAIRPLERARALGIATDDELAELTELESYSVMLMRVDTRKAPNISWPQKPN